MIREVTLPFPDGPERVRVALPQGQVPIEALMPAVFELVDALVRRKERAAAASGRPLTCQAGCSACCTQVIPVSDAELRHLRGVLERLSEEDRDRILERFSTLGAKLDRLGLTDRLQSPPTDEGAYNTLARDYFLSGAPCPFLTDEGRCSVYKDRPAICREYAVTSPPRNCDDPYTYGVSVVASPVQLTLVVSHVVERLTGERGRVRPLALGFDAVPGDGPLVDAAVVFEVIAQVVVAAIGAE